MTTATARMKEHLVSFAVGPAVKGIVPVYFAIPDGAWARMTDHRSSDFNLVPHGVPLQMTMTRCKDRAEGLALLRTGAGMQGETNPDAKEDWIVLAVGEGTEALVVMLLIPEAARIGMVERNMKHEFDLTKRGVPIVIQLVARRTHAACMAAIHGAVAGDPIRDITDQDVSFDVDTGVRQ